MRVKAVLWDIDGTFVDSEPTHRRALVDALAKWGVRPSKATLRRALGTSIEAAYATVAAEHAGLPKLCALVAAKLEAYLARVGELRLRFGVEPVEALLRARTVRQAFVSNSDRTIVDANMSAVGALRPGLVTVSRNDVRNGKPDPEPYLRAAHLLGLAPRDCLVVEDSPLGATAGLSAGMTVIAWPQRPGPDLPFPAGARIADPIDLLSAVTPMIDGCGG